MDRRHFLGATFFGASALAFGSVWSQANPNLGTPTPAAPGFRRTKVGAMEVIAINDGVTRRPLGEEFVTNAPLEQVKALLASQSLPTEYVDVPYTPFLVVSGSRRVLFDVGFADNGPPTTGRLRANMEAAGYKLDDITDVVISHFHPDHINGLRSKDGSLVFPRARVHVPAPEHAFWTDEARMNAAPQAARGTFQNAQRVMGGIPAAQLVRFEPGAEIAPGIVSSAAFGHTPGMCIFRATSENQSFHYVADVTNIPALFARNPDWAVVFDMDPNAARLTRRRVFDSMVRERAFTGGYHFPFPAFGTMEAAGSGYAFKPVA
ncbi:MAG TPA: MBL fold metallo-hydrolase [Ramlibacter sp.]|jgi:glyoxylase-like metal-dependent hydrolase (beta-lactamase superfamily II)|nr:MBL fold metallo-hydrolase [Ramlibacter sp.]